MVFQTLVGIQEFKIVHEHLIDICHEFHDQMSLGPQLHQVVMQFVCIIGKSLTVQVFQDKLLLLIRDQNTSIGQQLSRVGNPPTRFQE